MTQVMAVESTDSKPKYWEYECEKVLGEIVNVKNTIEKEKKLDAEL